MASSASKKRLILLGSLLLAIVIVLVVFIPCPETNQFYVFHVTLAIAAACLVALIPGFINIQLPMGVTAGGAVAVFVLVFFTNPEKSHANSKCRHSTFPFTVRLEPSQVIQVGPEYPTFKPNRLRIWIQNEWKSADVQADGVAHFMGIDGSLIDSVVEVRLEAEYWKLTAQRLRLTGSSAFAQYEPDGSLARVGGLVRDLSTSLPVAAAVVRISGATDTTSAEGTFGFTIPFEQQRLSYRVTTGAIGYNTKEESLTASREWDIRLNRHD